MLPMLFCHPHLLLLPGLWGWVSQKESILGGAKMITFFEAPPITMGFCLQSKLPVEIILCMDSKSGVHLSWEMEEKKSWSSSNTTVLWISSARVHWETRQSHSGLQGSV